MEALALILIALGGIGLWQVSKGRAVNAGTDVSDAIASLSRGDFDGVSEVLTRQGEDAFAAAAATVGQGNGDIVPRDLSGTRAGGLLAEMQSLAAGANNRYVLGATGPSSYDCSGLVWRAMRNLSIYNGPRFTTATFENQCSQYISAVTDPQVNDVILWRSGHMGVYAGNGKCFAAKSARSGIGYQSATDKIRGVSPRYYRWTGVTRSPRAIENGGS